MVLEEPRASRQFWHANGGGFVSQPRVRRRRERMEPHADGRWDGRAMTSNTSAVETQRTSPRDRKRVAWGNLESTTRSARREHTRALIPL